MYNSAMTEYLIFSPPELSGLGEGQVLAPHFLRSLVIRAFDFITSEPGPNLRRRKELAPGWLGWWMDFLRDYSGVSEKFVPCDRLVSFPEVNHLSLDYQRRGYMFGVAFMATGEMTEGQRKFLDQAKSHVSALAVGLEEEQYFARHPDRRPPCLPKAMRQAMVTLLSHYVFDIPSLPEGVIEDDHYDQIYAQTQALSYFYTEGDPDESRKRRRRGAVAIPEFATAHASQMTEKLMPDEHTWYLLEELNRINEQQYSRR